ncbi:MAG TPA: hypothetical protein P5127_02060 [Oscillospiraceae bacterium]|nr:hypothetical protein [Oscillospiraceae bacterium]
MQEKYENLRREYPVCSYDGYHISVEAGSVLLTFDFSIPGLCEFHPKTKIVTENLQILNSPDSLRARGIAFALGMVEAVSYWKSVCSPEFVIICQAPYFGEKDFEWWKKLWFNGLGEFFYKNKIEADFDDFVNLKFNSITQEGERDKEEFTAGGLNIIPVGGGKDSCVSLDLLKAFKNNNLCFTVNDQEARRQTAEAAGYGPEDTIRTYREIDTELLRLNREGFLNGHTPFSAIVAFLSLYCAHLTGAENIVLSNESSANEASVHGTDINHQYSKSFEFEKDFSNYVQEHFGGHTRYFSLLRAFNELQIAKRFASLKEFHKAFRSCNVGSKKNIWCKECSKCLFVYIVLSPFMAAEELKEIFGEDLLDKVGLLEEFKGLIGLLDLKPFECVGTVDEVRYALAMTAEKYASQNLKMPALLEYYVKEISRGTELEADLLKAYEKENAIPEEFLDFVAEMYEDVSKTD